MLISIRDCKYSKKDRHWIEYVYGEYMDSLADLNTGLYKLIDAGNPQQGRDLSRTGSRTTNPIRW